MKLLTGRTAFVCCFLLASLATQAQCDSLFWFYTNTNTPYTIYANQPQTNPTDAIYIWNWNDGSPNDTTYQSNTNSPTITHDFPATGVYSVCVNCQSVSGGCNVSSCQNFTVSSMTMPPKQLNILYTSVTPSWTTCPTLPATAYNYLSFDMQGYTPSNDIVAELLFGDGTDTTITVRPYYSSSGIGYAQISHTHLYSMPGLYSLQYIIHDPAWAVTDTLTKYNSVDAQDSCGNLNGVVYLDNNSNCLYDGGDSVLSCLWVDILGPGNNYYGYGATNNAGYYSASVPTANTYTLSVPGLTSYGYTYACGGAGLNNVTAPATVNIGVMCPPGFDLAADFGGWRFRPSDSAFVHGRPINNTCTAQSGTVTLTLDVNTTFIHEAVGAPVTVNGNQLSWNFNNLVAWHSNWWYSSMGYRYLIVDCSTNLQIGDSVCFTMDISPISGDMDSSNNSITHCYPVKNSWDPNFKEVYPRGVGAQGYVAQNTEFMYMIHFQNTGTASAYNIAVVDTMDADLDLGTFQVINASHNVSPHYVGNDVLKFEFNNIMLPDSASDPVGSQGWVTYKIKAKPNQPGGTQYTNTAYIYFDFNPAIITNTTLNTISLGVGVNEIRHSFTKVSLVPNPVSDQAQLSFYSEEAGNAEMWIVNMLGETVTKELQTVNKGKNVLSVDTRELADGLYILQLRQGSSVLGSVKMVK